MYHAFRSSTWNIIPALLFGKAGSTLEQCVEKIKILHCSMVLLTVELKSLASELEWGGGDTLVCKSPVPFVFQLALTAKFRENPASKSFRSWEHVQREGRGETHWVSDCRTASFPST